MSRNGNFEIAVLGTSVAMLLSFPNHSQKCSWGKHLNSETFSRANKVLDVIRHQGAIKWRSKT
jgi:hypothetical protein